MALPIDVFIPPEKVRHSEWRQQNSPCGRIPKDLDTKARMRRKLRIEHGRTRYCLRQHTVEPVFGQIKWNRGLHRFFMRGLAAARASWGFDGAVPQLLKLRSAGVVLA